MRRRLEICAWTLLFLATAPARGDDIRPEDREFFESKVRPVLAENCFRCHGAARQKAELRLDNRASILKGGESGPALVPGDLSKSLIAKAISYEHADFRMPPKGKLADEEIASLRRWIERGAFWPHDKPVKTAATAEFDLKERSKHWSLQPLRQVAMPQVANQAWPRSPIDYFILAKLEDAGLVPNAPAERRTLLRRVTYDLIGLPPTPAEIDAFLADDSKDAFARVVDRLLESPHYGERWGRHWLDLVRYAETRGHEFDFEIPEAYLYRDYVIRAFNADVPFDQFVLEHVAGDLLPEPRRHPSERFNESILGTGFFFLGEGKHSPVDVRSDQADRRDNQIDVFSKTFLGMTVACARCHDHKFDAISTADYYALAGFFESSRFQRAFFDDPTPTQKVMANLRGLQRQCRDKAAPLVAKALHAESERLAGLYPVGRRLTLGNGKPFANPADFEAKRALLLKQAAVDVSGFAGFSAKSGWIATGFAFDHGDDNPLIVNDKIRGIVPLHQAHSGLVSDRLEGMLQSPTFTIAAKKIHYLAAGKNAKINLIIDGFQLIRSPIYGGLTIAVNHGEQPRWLTMDVTMWQGHRAYIEVLDDGPGFVALQRVAFSDSPPALPPIQLLLRLLADDRAKSPEELSANYRKLFDEIVDQFASGTLARQADAADRNDVLNWMLENVQGVPAGEDVAKLTAEVRRVEATLPTPQRALAMLDGTPVDEHIFQRGNHKKLGEIVQRRFLEVFGGKEKTLTPGPSPGVPGEGKSAGSGRLELARRMVDPHETPILPRVFVNRIWKHHFGEGIVTSTDDFGVLGQSPSHPELLDFLAGEFVKNGWSIKKLHRLILLSSVYQMSSARNTKGDKVDPVNKLLQRMPVRRLEAEIIRDATLAVSGRLERTLFGPSVLPHLTPFMAGRGRPAQSGPLDGNGRRSIYINVRRNFLTPLFVSFDYPTPFSTIGRRSVSNVPAQALSMMNNPLIVQQAELWAKQVLAKPGVSRKEGVTQMYETAFARPPSDGEMQQALGFLSEQTATYGRAEPAWSDLGHVLFNLKEFIFIQ